MAVRFGSIHHHFALHRNADLFRISLGQKIIDQSNWIYILSCMTSPQVSNPFDCSDEEVVWPSVFDVVLLHEPLTYNPELLREVIEETEELLKKLNERGNLKP